MVFDCQASKQWSAATVNQLYKMNPPRSQSDADPNLVPFSGQASPDVIREGVSVLHLNVEGLTKAKINVIEQLLQTHKATVVLLQETHTTCTKD